MLTIWFALLVGCQHHRDVRPSPDGVHTVAFYTDDKGEGAREAIAQADHFCQETEHAAVILSESIEYFCEMEEAEYIVAKNLARAAEMAGHVLDVDDTGSDNTGDIISAAGTFADEALGDCYEVDMRFECH